MHDERTNLESPSTAATIGVCLALFLVTFAAAAAGAVVSQPGEWYAALARPPLAPPNWIFGPVWTTLYLMMAIAVCWCWYSAAQAGQSAVISLTFYVVQLALNALWSWLFFHFHQIGWALVDIGILWLLLVVTLIAFWRNSTVAGLLFLPYVLWVSFASYLNYGFWRLN